MLTTELRCHCGCEFNGSDHCRHCGCEQYEAYCDEVYPHREYRVQDTGTGWRVYRLIDARWIGVASGTLGECLEYLRIVDGGR